MAPQRSPKGTETSESFSALICPVMLLTQMGVTYYYRSKNCDDDIFYLMGSESILQLGCPDVNPTNPNCTLGGSFLRGAGGGDCHDPGNIFNFLRNDYEATGLPAASPPALEIRPEFGVTVIRRREHKLNHEGSWRRIRLYLLEYVPADGPCAAGDPPGEWFGVGQELAELVHADDTELPVIYHQAGSFYYKLRFAGDGLDEFYHVLVAS